MSATNRGSNREKNDAYPTPSWCVDRLLEELRLPSAGTWFDPCVGAGSIVKAAYKHYPDVNWSGTDIDEQYSQLLDNININYKIVDFLQATENDFKPLMNGKNKFDVILTNPPYNLAFEFLKKSLEIADYVAMLLRVNFIASKKRSEFMRSNAPDLYVLPQRPSFKKTAKSSTDASEYAWFVYTPERNRSSGSIQVLNCNNK